MENDIIGAWLSIPVQLRLNGRKKTANWLSSTAIARKGQRKGLGRKIYRKIVSSEQIVLGVGVVPASQALYTSEGAKFLHADLFGVRRASNFSAFRDFLRLLRRFRFGEAKVHLAALLRRLRPAKTTEIDVETDAETTGDLNDFFSVVLPRLPITTDRNCDFIQWMRRHPRFCSVVFLARQKGVLVGYALARQDGLILDLLVNPDCVDASAALLNALSDWARRENLDLSSILTGIPEIRNSYLGAGFVPKHDFGLFFAPTEDPDLNEFLANPERWYVSMADSDLWSFQLDRF